MEAAREMGREDRIEVGFTGCHGFCQKGPIVVVEPEGHLLLPGEPQGRQGHRPSPSRRRRAGQAALLPPSRDQGSRPLLPGHHVLQEAAAGHPAELRQDQPGEDLGIRGPRGISGPPESRHGHDAGRGRRRGPQVRTAGTRRGGLRHGDQVGRLPEAARRRSSTSSATPTRATPGPSWTAASWRPTPTPSWKG